MRLLPPGSEYRITSTERGYELQIVHPSLHREIRAEITYTPSSGTDSGVSDDETLAFTLLDVMEVFFPRLTEAESDRGPLTIPDEAVRLYDSLDPLEP